MVIDQKKKPTDLEDLDDSFEGDKRKSGEGCRATTKENLKRKLLVMTKETLERMMVLKGTTKVKGGKGDVEDDGFEGDDVEGNRG